VCRREPRQDEHSEHFPSWEELSRPPEIENVVNVIISKFKCNFSIPNFIGNVNVFKIRPTVGHVVNVIKLMNHFCSFEEK